MEGMRSGRASVPETSSFQNCSGSAAPGKAPLYPRTATAPDWSAAWVLRADAATAVGAGAGGFAGATKVPRNSVKAATDG